MNYALPCRIVFCPCLHYCMLPCSQCILQYTDGVAGWRFELGAVDELTLEVIPSCQYTKCVKELWIYRYIKYLNMGMTCKFACIPKAS